MIKELATERCFMAERKVSLHSAMSYCSYLFILLFTTVTATTVLFTTNNSIVPVSDPFARSQYHPLVASFISKVKLN